MLRGVLYRVQVGWVFGVAQGHDGGVKEGCSSRDSGTGTVFIKPAAQRGQASAIHGLLGTGARPYIVGRSCPPPSRDITVLARN